MPLLIKHLMENNDYNKKSCWLCPHEARNQKIAPRPFETALEYKFLRNIPRELMDKEVKKLWLEDDGKTLCIIWYNELAEEE